MGQLLDRRPGAALTLAVVALALGGLAAALIRHPVSDTLLLLLLCLSVYSVWETATSTFPPPAVDQRRDWAFRSVRLGFLSVGVVSSTAVAGLMILSRGYGLWSLNTDQAAPVLLPGDQFVMRIGGLPRMELRRGDIVFVRWMRTLRVVALPGERVNPMDGALQTGTPPVLSAQPQFPPPPLAPATTVDVPPGWIALGPTVVGAGERPTLLLLPESFINGRVVAIYSPPARRRWFR
ncbi:MAG TPA: hypothetical protein VK689_13940 [Armatimonadota bacterium]|nr:hypothetical protein [Armatimonadota bacterium]